jgi:hypothetical protein
VYRTGARSFSRARAEGHKEVGLSTLNTTENGKIYIQAFGVGPTSPGASGGPVISDLEFLSSSLVTFFSFNFFPTVQPRFPLLVRPSFEVVSPPHFAYLTAPTSHPQNKRIRDPVLHPDPSTYPIIPPPTPTQAPRFLGASSRAAPLFPDPFIDASGPPHRQLGLLDSTWHRISTSRLQIANWGLRGQSPYLGSIIPSGPRRPDEKS